jgi:serine/threonine-protein kinase
MEYVEGEPITTYCATRQRTVAERLQLVRQVAEAVQFAHGHAVLHRDLKPSNVLVTATGAVKLVDFGIAKQLDPSGEVRDRTTTGLRLLTPAYAAPEQWSGGPIGVRTDVHALGVLMYELLTGRAPWSDVAGTDAELLAARLKPAPRPSALAGTPGSAPGRVTWSELDVLVTTAMHPDPARRYGTVEALLRDLDHFERGEPLEARPDSLGYRTSRFVRRNWAAVGVGTVLAGAIIGVSLYYAVRLARARDLAVAEAARTTRIQGFMLSLFRGDESGAGPAESLQVRTLLDRGVREAAALDAEPLVQAELYLTLGELFGRLGRNDEADTLIRNALALRRGQLGADHPDVGAALVALGELRIHQARLDDAAPLIRDGAAMIARHAPPADLRAIASQAALGLLHQERAEWPEAVAAQEEVLRRLDLAGDSSVERGHALLQLGSSHFYAGALELSDSLNRLAMALYRRRVGDRHPLVADALINLGAAEFERGRYAAAEGYYREAVARIEAWNGADHPATASALTMLGRALNFQARDDEATAVLSRALAIQERAFGPDHPRVASALNDIATIAMRNGRYGEAQAMWLRTERIYLAVHGERHWLLGVARSNLGTVLMRQERFPEAEGYLRRAVALFTEAQGPGHLNTGIARIKLGRSLLGQRRWREAAEESEAGLGVLRALEEAPQAFIDAARTDLAAAYEALGDGAKAAEFRQ